MSRPEDKTPPQDATETKEEQAPEAAGPASPPPSAYTPQEEEIVLARLRALGYL
ncbi:MAG: hypothetical protein AB1814_02750 [Thermodesulfobacteriota bacterium]